MSRKFLFTVDLDRDVNLPVEGSMAAGSVDRGFGTSPRFESAERGLSVLLDVLDDVGMKATFYVEGRTSEVVDCSVLSGHCIGFHGYDHEDLTGVSTGVPMDADVVEGVMRRGFDAVRDNVSEPVCFRAPYMVSSPDILAALGRLGIRSDSSVYSFDGCSPYVLPCGISEYPVPKARDSDGRVIAGYLWPMHEGKRVPQQYIDMASSCDDVFMLATHTWHMVESRDGGVMDRDGVKANADAVRTVLEGVLDTGFRPAFPL